MQGGQVIVIYFRFASNIISQTRSEDSLRSGQAATCHEQVTPVTCHVTCHEQVTPQQLPRLLSPAEIIPDRDH